MDALKITAAAFSAFAATAGLLAAMPLDSGEVSRWADECLRRDLRWVMTADTPDARMEAEENAKHAQSATGETRVIEDGRVKHKKSQAKINRKYNLLAREIEVAFTNTLAGTDKAWLSEHVGARREEFEAFAFAVRTNGISKIKRKFMTLGSPLEAE